MSGLRNLAFSVEEYRGRVARVQLAMAERELDALVLRNRADVCWVTGIETCYMVAFHTTVIPVSGEPILLTSDFEMLNALPGAWCEDRETFRVGDDPILALGRVLSDRGWSMRRVGFEPAVWSLADWQTLRGAVPGAELVPAGEILPQHKLCKSPAEIGYLREAARISDLGVEAALAELRPGSTDQDLVAAASDAMVRAGSEFMCIDPIVTVGLRSGIPHTTCRRTLIEPGDSVLIEVGGCICRYSAPIMRSAAVGPVPDPLRRAADACQASLEALLGALRPGAVARDVAAVARAAWMPLCEELVWHGIYAYSVGIGFPPDWNDAPACITTDSDLVLAPGMCFHATNSLRLPAQFGTACSETVVITATGCEVLTRTPREFQVKSFCVGRR